MDARDYPEMNVEVHDTGVALHDGKLRLSVKSDLSGIGGRNGLTTLILELDDAQANHFRDLLELGSVLLQLQKSTWPRSDSEA